MEVTRLNFRQAFPFIAEAIEDASFLAIDAEFSGLTSRKRENALDTCEERYQKLINGVRDFTILQFGVCAFCWNDEQQLYVAKPFNFYIFPKPYNRQMPDMRFLCQSSSLDFLSGKGFDFNKWIYHGIPFVLPSDEAKLRDTVNKHRPNQPTPDDSEDSSKADNGFTVSVPPHFEKPIELIMQKIQNFMEDQEQKSLSLPPASPLLRKLVYDSVQAAGLTELYLESKVNEGGEKFILISKVSEEEKKALEEKKTSQLGDEIELAIGFSKVVRLMSHSGKIILGHNMMLDLLHLMRLFIAPLPSNLDGFKSLAKGVLPRLIDTKVMASTPPLQSHLPLSHLEIVYQKTSEAPFMKPNILLPEGFGQYSDGNKAHEAGFDAFMTGVSFIAMASFLQKGRDGENPCGELDFEIVKPFLNKIFLYPRMEDIPYLNLSGNDLTPSRDHVFYVEHPEGWHYTDIQKLFKDVGYVYVTVINNTAAFVSVAKRERASKVMQKLNRDDAPYRIMTYKEYYHLDSDEGDNSDDHKDCADGNVKESSHEESSSYSLKRLHEVDVSDEEKEEGELPDSPAKPAKKLKNEHIWFEEPEEW